MLQGNLALKLKDFEEDYCYPYIMDSSKQNLPDNIIQFPVNNQLVQKSMPGDTVNYSYDDIGNLVLVSDDDSNDSFIYDLTSRLTSATQTSGVTISYTYDKNGNRLAMADPTGTTSYTYDVLNRPTTLINPNAQTTTFNYDELSRRTSITSANGITTDYSYDVLSQLLAISHQPLAIGYDYTYDKVGNRTSMTELAGLNNYTYDVLNRLTTATHPQPTNPAETFTYGSVGNRLSSHISVSYTYDAANRLLEDEQYTYIYDNNGNLTSKTDKTTSATTVYIYNPENQLIRIDFSDDTYAAYAYDGLGRRIQKDVNGAITKYIYDNEDVLLEYDGTNTIIARYTHGLGIDEPLIMDRGGNSYSYYADGLGSITVLTDASGNILQTYVYDSFGNIVEQIGSLTNPYTYTGREYDSESGLYYYRARYYDAKTGRFLQEDPLWNVNLYAYCNNNPINFIDPLGLYIPWYYFYSEAARWIAQNLPTLQDVKTLLEEAYKNFKKWREESKSNEPQPPEPAPVPPEPQPPIPVPEPQPPTPTPEPVEPTPPADSETGEPSGCWV